MGGKEIPGYSGEIGAYIAKILPGGSAEQTGKLVEGKNKDFRVNWNECAHIKRILMWSESFLFFYCLGKPLLVVKGDIVV